MKNILKISLFCLISSILYSCSNIYKEEAERSARSSSARDRINSGQSGSSSVFDGM